MGGSIAWMFILLTIEIYLVTTTDKKLKDRENKFELDMLVRYALIIIVLVFMISIIFNIIINAGSFSALWVPDWLLIYTNDLSVWINYFGSLFGAFLGGIVTLAVMYQSIKTQRETTKEIVKRYDRQYDAENKPCLRVYLPAINSEGDNTLSKNITGYARIINDAGQYIIATNNIYKEEEVQNIMNGDSNEKDWFDKQRDLAPLISTYLVLENVMKTPAFSVSEHISDAEEMLTDIELEDDVDLSRIKLARVICDIKGEETYGKEIKVMDFFEDVKNPRKALYPTDEERNNQGIIFKKALLYNSLYEYEMHKTLYFKNINDQMYSQDIKILFRINRSEIRNNLARLYSSVIDVSSPKLCDEKVLLKYMPEDPPGVKMNPPQIFIPTI